MNEQANVTDADNDVTVSLTEWLIKHDKFDEDDDTVMLDFGDYCDPLVANHRTQSVAALQADYEKLREALEEVKSRRRSVVDLYERNGPQWTSPDTGSEYENTSDVVSAAQDDADFLEAALSDGEGSK